MTIRKPSFTLSTLFIAAGALIIALAIWLLSPAPEQPRGAATASSGNEKAEAAGAGKEDASPALGAELKRARAEVAQKEAQMLELQWQLKTAEIKNEQATKPAPWLRDPEMIKVLKSEAKSAATRSAAALLDAGLAQQLQLNEEQSDALKQLLVERSSIVWDTMLLPVTGGELDPGARSAAGQATKQAIARNAAEIRALVGPEGFKTFQWFEQTQPDRDLFKRFTPQFAQAGHELDAEQQNQLLAMMIDERRQFPKLQEFGDPMQMDFEHWEENFTEEKVATHFHQMEQLNDRIAQRAQSVLTPEQVAVLRQLNAEHLRRSQFTVRNTKLMMGQKR